jgi:hypothetical protein
LPVAVFVLVARSTAYADFAPPDFLDRLQIFGQVQTLTE